MNVNILMSTYNGQEFLAEQIRSIQAQTFTDWTLLIRDDGSKDKTREIIADFAQQDSRIHFINPDSTENLGVIKSFHALVQYQRADVYFFSDQDDVWLQDKLQVTLETAQAYPADQPLMVYTDLKVVDQDLQVMNESMIRSQSHHANTELVQELTENTVTGGTSMINHALAELWTVTDDILMHDWYLALLATAFGKLVYIDQPTELYRQHDNNVLGARTMDKRFKIFRYGPKFIFTRYWKLIHDSQKQAAHLLEFSQIKLEDRELIEHFVDIDKQNMVERIRRIVKYRYSKNQWKHILVFRTLLITNFYNGRNK
ncbi:glycosyltransferase family 2 protein [Streptococcus suis]|nr:glycosyltransferase family 2 protein [Streptococcus suis]